MWSEGREGLQKVTLILTCTNNIRRKVFRMKKFFYISLIGLALFEVANVYFIMPMPGSQRINSLNFAYFLYSYRWIFRVVFTIPILFSAVSVFTGRRKWIPVVSLLLVTGVVYAFNFVMVADHMFLQPQHLVFKSKDGNVLNDSSIVVSVENNGQVKAYPLRFIVYHHQVQDTVGGKPIIATYCSVCRTGRVYEPTVKGKPEKFRLVGMDHFNAMFEDISTKSWWRQATGEAVTGSLKGEILPEIESMQLSIKKLFDLYPHALVMQMDTDSKDNYDSLGKFEKGRSRGKLTRTDTLSWRDKSWVVGIQLDGKSKAYDWIQLKKLRVINDEIGSQAVAIVLAPDNQSFAAFTRSSAIEKFSFRNDSIFVADKAYAFSGKGLTDPSLQLNRVKAYQEFWHSWKTFHPTTEQYR